MEKTSKVISGLPEGKFIIRKPIVCFTDSEKHHIIQELLSSGCTKAEIWQKYTGRHEEHGQILRWMRKLGYDNSVPHRRSNFAGNISNMSKKKTTARSHISEDFEKLQLKNRIAELESQLKDAEMKAIAFSTMVDIAEKEFNIPIRKKYNTKPSKK